MSTENIRANLEGDICKLIDLKTLLGERTPEIADEIDKINDEIIIQQRRYQRMYAQNYVPTQIDFANARAYLIAKLLKIER